MSTILATKMTKLEKVRLRNFKKNNKDAKAYYSRAFSFGVGHDIIASIVDLTKESNRVLIDSINSKFVQS